MYANGQGVKQDHGEAVRWYRKSADQGNAATQFNLGAMYYNGQGVKQDFGEALVWFRKSAAQEFPGAEESALIVEGELHKLQVEPPPTKRVSPATPTSHTCANCGVKETAGSVALKPCSRCKAVVYCGRECQAKHWKVGGHRTMCKS
jgi:TPR repeat protein